MATAPPPVNIQSGPSLSWQIPSTDWEEVLVNEMTSNLLEQDTHIDDIADGIYLLLGFDEAIQTLAAHPSDKAGQAIFSILTALFLEDC